MSDGFGAREPLLVVAADETRQKTREANDENRGPDEGKGENDDGLDDFQGCTNDVHR